MTDPAGGFYSTQDADSESEEGKFFVWTPAELATVLGTEAARTFAAIYDVTAAGNFEGANILHRDESLETWAARLGRDLPDLIAELAASRKKLLASRRGRVPPARDDKVLVSWNGLMIEGSAQRQPLWPGRAVRSARRAADFLLSSLQNDDGRLLHCSGAGHAKLAAYLDDYAALAAGLAALYQSSFDEQYLDAACQLADVMLAHFRDPQNGGFFYTADDHPPLIARTQDLYDNATPSGNSLAATALVRLGKLTGRDDYLSAATAMFERDDGRPAAVADSRQSNAARIGHVPGSDAGNCNRRRSQGRRHLCGCWPICTAVTGPTKSSPCGPIRRQVRRDWQPFFRARSDQAAGPTTYLCQEFACQAPAVGVDATANLLNAWQKTER